MRSVRGFTLIELMVTIVVLAIIAMMAAPSFSNMILRQNLNKSARELMLTLNDARSKAALQRNAVTVNLNSTTANTDITRNWAPAGKSVLISSTSTIVFRADGLIQNSAATGVLGSDLTLVLCDQAQAAAQYSKRITISRVGTILQGDLVTGSCS